MGDLCSICSEIHLLKVHGLANQNHHFAKCSDSNITDVGNLVIIKKVGKGSSLKVIKFQDKWRKLWPSFGGRVLNKCLTNTGHRGLTDIGRVKVILYQTGVSSICIFSVAGKSLYPSLFQPFDQIVGKSLVSVHILSQYGHSSPFEMFHDRHSSLVLKMLGWYGVHERWKDLRAW